MEGLAILVCAHKSDREALSTEASGAADTVKVAICIERHVKVEDDINLLDVDTATEKLSSNENAVAELLESLVNLKSNMKDKIQITVSKVLSAL